MHFVKLLPFQIWGNSEINGARKVKSDAQVAMNKLGPRAEIFSYRGWGGRCLNSYLPNVWNCHKRVALGSSFGLHINISLHNAVANMMLRSMCHIANLMYGVGNWSGKKGSVHIIVVCC